MDIPRIYIMRIPNYRLGPGWFLSAANELDRIEQEDGEKFLSKLKQRQEDLMKLAGVPMNEYQKDWNVVPGR